MSIWMDMFGWMTLINIGLYLITALAMLGYKDRIIALHSRLTGLSSQELNLAYVGYLTLYKLLIIFFNLVPYLALTLSQ